MVTAILGGLIPIVSNTDAYSELASALGVPELVYDHESEILSKCSEFSDFVFNEQHYHILKSRYSVEVVQDRFFEMIRSWQ
jgi:hypothetical protein